LKPFDNVVFLAPVEVHWVRIPQGWLKNAGGRTDIEDKHNRISPWIFLLPQMKQSQVAETAQILVLKKAMDIQANGAMALLQALPLATSGNLGTQINTMA
jgi:hypothetical protein